MGKNVDKAFLSLGAKPVIVYSLQAIEKCREIEEVILVVRKDRMEIARNAVRMFGCSKVKKIIDGGAQRKDSVAKGLKEISDECKVIVVHDGVRPCVTPELFTLTVQSAQKHGSGVAAVKITDTVKEIGRTVLIANTVDRTKLWLAQTPQAFNAKLLKTAYDHVQKNKLLVTDESAAVEQVAKNVRIVPSTSANIKITTPDDLVLASALMRL
ncbi:MAG: 2-C-methyl-D-erythritol 4-phosphate cytidylyltransferase [Lentisphaerae bacterium]|nr:2-C-methyl-D-erythritol 4-phosphate cytidylyltransferase [Lentisphaerota bacterium]